MEKCKWPDGIKLEIKGHEVDPCQYEEIEKWTNCIVTISRCKRCGNIDISWQKTEESERIE